MVTRSANDAAVVIAEAIAGDEREFAKLMTRKARALGMSRTVYKNASGLPDDDQVTTARDQSTLGRAVQEQFPRYYKYFSIRSFTFRGQSISNHNHLLGKVEGVDGIKTGYINASGFNLVTSVHRGNRYVVAVVMGGATGASRDARMRDLITDKIALASTKRTTSMLTEAANAPESAPEPKVAAKPESKPEAKPELKVASTVEATSETKPEAPAKNDPKAGSKAESKQEAKAEGKAKNEPRFAVASAISVPVRFSPGAAQAKAEAAPPRAEPAVVRTEAAAPSRIPAGSTDPIRPVLVKTLTVRGVPQAADTLADARTPAFAPSQPARVAAPTAPAPTVVAAKAEAPAPAPAEPQPPLPAPAAVSAKLNLPVATPAAAKPESPAQAPAAKAEPAAPVAAVEQQPSPVTPPLVAATKTDQTMPLPTARPATSARITNADPARVPAADKPQHRSGWMIQVGAYPAERAAQQALSSVQSKASKMLGGAEAFTETIEKGGTTYYRARFAGLDKDTAEAACKYLKKNDVDCVTIKN
jgi:D-alanyl-D-alanine carboxypeptidase